MSPRLMHLTLVALVLLSLTSLAWPQADVAAQIAQAKQLKQQRQLPEAQRLLEQVLAQAPQNPEAHYVLAWVLVGQGKNDPAAEHFRKVLELAPNADLARDATKALQRLGFATNVPPGGAQPPAPAPQPTPQPAVQPAGEPALPQATAQQEPLNTQMIDDFEADDAAWYGLKRMTEAAGTGKAGGAWLDTVTAPTVMTHALRGSDWSDFTHLQFDCNSAVANDALITIALKSDDPAVEGNDFYWMRLRLNWVGWKVLQFPLKGFTAGGKPLGFSNIQNIQMACNWGPCKPLADTVLYFDNFKVVKLPETRSLVLGNMEDDLDFWQGLAPETTLVKEGQQAGRWEKLDEVPSLRCAAVPKDWRPFGALHLWVHAAVANDQELRVIAWSDCADTKEMDGYRCDMKVDWQGWKELRLQDADFTTSYRPLGWDQITCVDVVGAGWGGMAPPRADTVLVFDDIRLEPADTEHDLPFMDFDSTRRTAFSEENAITDQIAHGGKYSLCWQPRQRPSLGFANLPHDWSAHEALSFWVKSDVAEELKMSLALVANRYAGDTEDHYSAVFAVPPGAWTRIVIPIKALQPQGRPLGLSGIQRMYFFGGESKSAAALMKSAVYFDDFVLTRGSTK